MVKLRPAFYIQTTVFAAAIGLLILLLRYPSVVGLVTAMQHRVMQWGAWSAFFYPLLFALCNILLLPGGILCIGSGFFFGLWWGFFIVMLGSSISAAVSFIVSRWLRQGWLRHKLSRYPVFGAVEPAV